MKTLQLALIAAMVTFSLLAMSQPIGDRNSQNLIPLEKAITMPELSQALHARIDPDRFLSGEREGLMIATVFIRGTRYMVAGTFPEWAKFFKGRMGILPYERDIPGNRQTE